MLEPNDTVAGMLLSVLEVLARSPKVVTAMEAKRWKRFIVSIPSSAPIAGSNHRHAGFQGLTRPDIRRLP